MAQDSRASVFVSTAVDNAHSATIPVKFVAGTAWLEMPTEDPYYDISPNWLWRSTNGGCIDLANNSIGHLFSGSVTSCTVLARGDREHRGGLAVNVVSVGSI